MFEYFIYQKQKETLHKKRCFPLRISLKNVTKSTGLYWTLLKTTLVAS